MSSTTVAIAAHNEEQYITGCLESIKNQTVTPDSVILVADRCTDRTVEIARLILPGLVVIEKRVADWRNSYSENLDIARKAAIGTTFFIVDADIHLPPDFIQRLLPQIPEYASVSAVARTDPSQGPLNRLVSYWEFTRRFAPYGEQPRGAARIVSLEALNRVGGFRDVIAVDSDLDMRLRESGYRVKLDRDLKVVHRRKMSLAGSIHYQIQAGRARRELGVSASRTILHSIGRLRPFVAIGYFFSPGATSQDSSRKN